MKSLDFEERRILQAIQRRMPQYEDADLHLPAQLLFDLSFLVDLLDRLLSSDEKKELKDSPTVEEQ